MPVDPERHPCRWGLVLNTRRPVSPFTVEASQRPLLMFASRDPVEMDDKRVPHGFATLARMAWSVQAKRNVIGVVWMVGGLALLIAAMMRNELFLTALVVLAIILFTATHLLSCPRCGKRVYPAGGVRAGLFQPLPDVCPHCGLKTTERA